jgi:UDP-glucuronate decarboxylase
MGRTSPVVARPLDQAVDARMYLETRMLVIGGTGFLGSHLCERLLDAGHQVLCVEQFFHRDVPEDDPKQRRPDVEYARMVLGWSPTVDLDEDLRRIIPYFESLLAEGPINVMVPSRSRILRVGDR